MARAVEIESVRPLVQNDRSDYAESRTPDDVSLATDRDFVVLRISGTLYFGGCGERFGALDGIAGHPKAYVIDFSAAPVLDFTAVTTIEGFVQKSACVGQRLSTSWARVP